MRRFFRAETVFVASENAAKTLQYCTHDGERGLSGNLFYIL